MFERFHRKSMTATLAAVLAALGVGGIALAQGGSTPPATTPPAANAPQAGQPADPADGPESANDKADGPEAANEKADPNEKPDANDAADTGTEQESGSEAPDSDGPGGHADEPANPNATTQQ